MGSRQGKGVQGIGPALTALYSYCKLRAVTSAMAAPGAGPRAGPGTGPGAEPGTGAGPDEAAPQPHRKLPQQNFRVRRKRRREPEVKFRPCLLLIG